jgi:hypothetical protein
LHASRQLQPAGTRSNTSTSSARGTIRMTPDDLAIPRDRFSAQRQMGRRKAQAA